MERFQILSVHILVAIIGALLGPGSTVFASPNLLTYQGRIVQSDNTPLEYPQTIFEFTVKSSTGCELYRETSGDIDMTDSKGLFDVAIGAGTKNFPSTSFKILDAFKNGATFNCENGGTYTAADGDSRSLHVRFFDGTSWKTITPDNQIRSVPFAAYANIAKEAQKLGTHSADDFVLKSSIPVCAAGTYLRHIAPTGTFQCSAITVAGADISGNIAGSSAGFTGLLVGDVSGTQGATVVDKIKNIPVNITGLTTGQVLKYNGTSWVAANDENSGGSAGITSLTGDVTTTGSGAAAATLADNVVTSAKILDGTIVNADISTSAAIADSKLATISTAGKVSGDAITSGTIGGSTSINTSGLIQTSNTVRFYSDSNKYTELRVPASLANDLIFQLPPTAGTTGQVLTTNGSGTLTWETISAGGGGTVTAVTASQPLSSSAGTTPNLTISQANTATDGYLSSTDWNTFNAKLGTTTAFDGDVSGTYNSVSVNKIKSKDVVPAAYSAGQVLRYDGTNWVNSVLGLGDISGTLTLNRGGTGATTASGARTALELGTAATKNTGAVAGDIPVLGAAGLVGNGFCTADSAGTGIICNTSAPAASQWTTNAPNIHYSSGNVGIGTASPVAPLNVVGKTVLGTATTTYTGGNDVTVLRSSTSSPQLLFDSGASSLASISWNANRFLFSKCSTTDCVSSSPYFTLDMGSNSAQFSNTNTLRVGNGNGSAATPTFAFTSSNNSGMFSPGSDVVAFGTASSERMRITSTGNVGIGVTNPSARLHVTTNAAVSVVSTNNTPPVLNLVKVNGTSYAAQSAVVKDQQLGSIRFGGSNSGTAGEYALEAASIDVIAEANFSSTNQPTTMAFSTTPANTTTLTPRLIITSEGRVGIGVSNPSKSLEVLGDIKLSGSVEANGQTLTSDLRFKRNIASVDSSLEKILNLRGVTYDWRQEEFPERKFSNKKQLGVIAQEVESQFPEAVQTDDKGFKSVSYTSLIAPLIESIKELFISKADVQRVEQLEKENEAMKQALCELGKTAFCK